MTDGPFMGNDWFDALGEPVPPRRREAAVEGAQNMGVSLGDSTTRSWVDTVAGKIERDQPAEAIDRARRHLDLTGAYRLLAYLCVDVPEDEPEGDVVDADLFDSVDHATFAAAIDHWGIDAQVDMGEEEAAEFVVASKHYARGKVGVEDVIDELADVRIMFEQLALYVGPGRVQSRVTEKMDRLRERLPDGAVEEHHGVDLSDHFVPCAHCGMHVPESDAEPGPHGHAVHPDCGGGDDA